MLQSLLRPASSFRPTGRKLSEFSYGPRHGCYLAILDGLLLQLVALMVLSTAHAQAADLRKASPPGPTMGQRLADDLNWSQSEREARFRRMDKLFPTHRIRRGAHVHALESGRPLSIHYSYLDQRQTVDTFMSSQKVAGLIVLQDGAVRLEHYGLGFKASERWTSFSITKAVTDTLAGIALHDGTIHRIDDLVTEYLPEMQGSAYDDVSIRQLMTMTSGVRWKEDYTTADADNVRLYTSTPELGKDPTIEYMRKLPRESKPGTHWVYNTGETDLLGVLIRRATGKPLAHLLSQAIWKRYGMEEDATWIAQAKGNKGIEFGGSGMSASLRDFARFGQWALEGGDGAVNQDWFAAATTEQTKTDGGRGYGFGWWPQPDSCFAALGIFGQSLFVDPRRKLVIVILSAWPQATGANLSDARNAFWHAVQEAAPPAQHH